MMRRGTLAIRLAEIALALADAAGLEDVCLALESGHLQSDSTAPVRTAVAAGSSAVEAHLRVLQDLWSRQEPTLSSSALAVALRASVAAAHEACRNQPVTQVVWTGPKVEGSFLRSTREVVRELIRGARRELLVTGYWIAARDEGEGIIEEVIESVGEAVLRGASVRIIVDERERFNGRNNRQVLLEAWPPGVPFPRVFTWRLPAGDRYLKLHAKVLVADGTDALVTSANLTFYAMDRNMEMGVRVVGAPASSIAEHFHRLMDAGVLEDFNGSEPCREF
jgi:phosphatidylserine/phosphatidylglycerophosphate/cardiolipin synthase-like enzyme